jgi:hypothetical protein
MRAYLYENRIFPFNINMLHNHVFAGAIVDMKLDALVKSQKCPRIVIPVKTGKRSLMFTIQRFQRVTKTLDTGFHRCDDFLREHETSFCFHRSLCPCRAWGVSPIDIFLALILL